MLRVFSLVTLLLVTTACGEANEALKFGCNAARVAQEIANGEENTDLSEAARAACERTAHCNENADDPNLTEQEREERRAALEQFRTMCQSAGAMAQMARIQGRDCEDALHDLFNCLAEADCADFGEENTEGVCNEHEESVQTACQSPFE